MKELLITNNDNTTSKTYAVYYTSKERYYVIYTEKKKDENGYVILNIAKVLKEVNSTPDGGVVPTGRFIGLEITEQNEWDNAKADIGMIVANLQDADSPVTVNYLPVENINGICIKSSKSFVLREDVFKAIINDEEETEQIIDTYEPQVEIPVVDEPVIPEPVVPIAEEPVAPAIPEPIVPEVAPAVLDETVENDFDSFDDELTVAPAIAPNPFDFQPLPTVDVEPVDVPEPTPVVNPYVELQKQRDEEMIRNLATDDMQDIIPTPVLTVDSLESNEEIAPAISEESVTSFEQQPVAAPVEESFVDSIVADVSNLVDSPIETNAPEDDSDYKQLYHDELEKTIELEKELKELHSKLNNIKNIVE